MNGKWMTMKNFSPSFAKLKIRYAILFLFLVISVSSCLNSNEKQDPEEYMEIYYFMGYIDTSRPCEKDFDPSETIDKGTVSIGKEEYQLMKNYIAGLQNVESDKNSTYSMCLQCNIYDSSRNFETRLSVGQFGPMSLGDNFVERNDTLLYLLRKNAGFYNYYHLNDLPRYCKEVERFGVPENYQDMTANFDTSNVLYAKIRILVE